MPVSNALRHCSATRNTGISDLNDLRSYLNFALGLDLVKEGLLGYGSHRDMSFDGRPALGILEGRFRNRVSPDEMARATVEWNVPLSLHPGIVIPAIRCYCSLDYCLSQGKERWTRADVAAKRCTNCGLYPEIRGVASLPLSLCRATLRDVLHPMGIRFAVLLGEVTTPYRPGTISIENWCALRRVRVVIYKNEVEA